MMQFIGNNSYANINSFDNFVNTMNISFEKSNSNEYMNIPIEII